MGWIKRQWEEIRPHAKWELVKAIIVSSAYPIVQKLRHLQWDWYVFGVLFLGSLIVQITWGKKRFSSQSTPQLGTNALTAVDFDAKAFLKTSYVSSLEPEVEARLRAIIAQANPPDLDSFYVKLLTKGAILFTYDMAWSHIYKSQVLLLYELNRKIMPVADAKSFYDRAASDKANIVYPKYTFEQWLNFLRGTMFVHVHPSAMVEITPRGRDFLKYLIHEGRSSEDRQY